MIFRSKHGYLLVTALLFFFFVFYFSWSSSISQINKTWYHIVLFVDYLIIQAGFSAVIAILYGVHLTYNKTDCYYISETYKGLLFSFSVVIGHYFTTITFSDYSNTLLMAVVFLSYYYARLIGASIVLLSIMAYYHPTSVDFRLYSGLLFIQMVFDYLLKMKLFQRYDKGNRFCHIIVGVLSGFVVYFFHAINTVDLDLHIVIILISYWINIIIVKKIVDSYLDKERTSNDLVYQSTHDHLTDIYNRREFERHLEQCLTHGEHGFIAFIDLDRFKLVNDIEGHLMGDRLLLDIVSIISKEIRHEDIFARIGGDEFAILFRSHDQRPTFLVCERIRESVAEYRFIVDDRVYRTTCSIGLLAIDKTSTVAVLLSNVDQACYSAKLLGRNRTYVYDKERDMSTVEAQWITKIRDVIDSEEFFLFIQPIVNIDHPRQIKYFEILVRLYDEKTNEYYTPFNIINMSERLSLIEDLDKIIIKKAFKTISQSSILQQHAFSINISGSSLSDGRFIDYVKEQIERYPIDITKIGFEITETIAISNYEVAIDFLKKVKDMGATTLLDDFGSGMSSFTYLKHLPIDVIKIDGTFVKSVADDVFSRTVVSSVVSLARVLQIKTTAEYVCNKDVFDILKELEVDYVQGFHLSVPFPMDCLAKMSLFDCVRCPFKNFTCQNDEGEIQCVNNRQS